MTDNNGSAARCAPRGGIFPPMSAATTFHVYENAAGLLSRMGDAARVEDRWKPPANYPNRRAVAAIVTDAPAIVVGYAVAMVAEEPEAHLPSTSARAGRVPHGQSGGTPWAFWLDNNE